MVGIFVLCLVHVLHHKEQLTEVCIWCIFVSEIFIEHVPGDYHRDHGNHVHHILGFPSHLWVDRVPHGVSCQGQNY